MKGEQQGIFIAFEGVEGSGKTVQAQRLCSWLKQRGMATILTREPGGTPLGEEVRRLLLQPEKGHIGPWTELFLFLAARAELVRDVIKPSLEAGKIVVSDRFSTSTLAYQAYGLGMELETVRAMNKCATGGLEATLSLILDVAPRIGLARRRGNRLVENRIEQRSLDFHERVRQGYLCLAEGQPEDFVIIDASPAEEVVWGSVKNTISELLGRLGRIVK